MRRTHDQNQVRHTRRVALCVAGGGVIALTAHRVGAQQASPDALPYALAEWSAGWQALDPDWIAAIYAPNAVHEVVATGQAITGWEATLTP